MMNKQDKHQSNIIDQFSKQAIPFTKLPGHMDSIQLLIELSKVSLSDTILDVACGPGLVTCEFAKFCHSAKGIDITPAMISQASKRQQESSLSNVSWDIGKAYPLPYDNDTFSLVITRYSMHHFLNPEQVIAEMIRVCKPKGRVLVADVAMDSDKSAAYDTLEIMRDPSHTHALTKDEFANLIIESGLADCCMTTYDVEIELEAQLKASFPNEGDTDKLREMITKDIGVDNLGIRAERKDGIVYYHVPISVYVGHKQI